MLKRRITLAVAATGAAALVAVAGCGSTGSAASGAVPIQAKLAAAEVLEQAAQKTQEVTSYTVDGVVEVSHPQEGTGKVQGRMVYQSQPQLAADLTLDTANFGGQSLPGGARAVLQGDTVYVKAETLNKVLGTAKPWIKVPLSEGGAEAKQFLDQVQRFDLANVTKLVTASQNVKQVGTETVGGVDTTHYSGTFPVDAAVSQLPADKQEQAKQHMAELQNVTFDIWVGSDGLPRKLAMAGEEKGAKFTANLFFKGFNEPVSIAAPPADQVGDLPRN
ncbi:LppX_LprAFG lipoprotein [Nonomuraea sp. NPDC059194]|uniref:LppX_LprAFG lipoprotein n=1 Tax=Nonomuraea sp. NPDC059194 TaxID=3346764 RepID=UPI00368FB429